jgi:hypothetical protein
VTDPGWVSGAFAVAMLTVSAYCAARLVVAHRLGRSLDYDVNVGHLAMGVAMAGMLSPALAFGPVAIWEGLFAALALWFVVRLVRFLRRYGVAGHSGGHGHAASHYLTHLVMSCSMLYMYFAAVPLRTVSGEAAMSMGPTPATAPFVGIPLLFVVVLCASAVWHVDAMPRFAPSTAVAVAATGGGSESVAQASSARLLAPRLESVCHVAMCIAMAFMLVLML